MYCAADENHWREKRNCHQNGRAKSGSACHPIIPPYEMSLARFSTGLLRGYLGTLFSSFRETDGDRLLAACHHPSLSVLARMERAALLSMHGPLHAFACRFAVF